MKSGTAARSFSSMHRVQWNKIGGAFFAFLSTNSFFVEDASRLGSSVNHGPRSRFNSWIVVRGIPTRIFYIQGMTQV